MTPGKNGYVPPEACNANWNYDPSFGAALIFTLLFGLTMSIHIFQAFYHKKFKLSWVIIMGATWEFFSFLLRTLGTRNQQSLAFAIVSQVLVLLAPLWINAFLYMVLGRMIYYFIPAQTLWGLKATSIAKYFVWLDVLSFITQLVGGVMIQPGSSGSAVMTGIHIYMGGIGLQEFFILIFICLCTKFFLVKRAEERRLSSSRNLIIQSGPSSQQNWRILLFAIYSCLTLITVRIIFRMIEFASGTNPATNPIPYHEAYFMCLDAFPMLLACILLDAIHPGRILVEEGSEFPKGLTRKEKKEANRIKKMEKKAAKEEKKQQKKEKNLLQESMV